jgi:hypothetical protein
MAREQLYGLTARTAGVIRGWMADGGERGTDAPSSGAAARGVTWVKVTSGPDGDGWHEGVVSLDVEGVWSDLADTVYVAAADFSELVEDNRYQCTRTGDDTGDACFRTEAPAATSAEVSGYSFYTAGNTALASSSFVDVGPSVTLPDVGTYEITYVAHGFLAVSSATTPGQLYACLFNDTTGLVVGRSKGFVGSTSEPYVHLATCTVKTVVVISTAGTVIKLRMARGASGATFTVASSLAATDFSLSIHYRKLP